MLGANGTCIRLRNFTRTRAEGPTFDSPGQAQRSPGIARPPEPRALKARYQHFPFRHFNFPISPFQLSHFAISTFPFRHFSSIPSIQNPVLWRPFVLHNENVPQQQ
jgi:hypothetical protein